MTIRSRTLQFAGTCLIALCVAGFLTIADDLRHTGEVIGVGAIGVVGVLLVLIGRARGR